MATGQALQQGTGLGDGRYVIEQVVGAGGFGITYRARDVSLQRDVAIKEFFLAGSSRTPDGVEPPPHLADEFEGRKERILDEARALARFRHPGIVTVHEFFVENGTVYVVMEYLEGHALSDELAQHANGLPPDRVLTVATEVGAALDAVHAENLLHRDIKPSNIMVIGGGHAVLVDFGTAREFAEGQSSLMSQTLTPGYAPVEQYTAHGRFGPPTDVYAFGATVYHLLTGVMPTASLDRMTGQELAPPANVNPAIPQRLSDAVMWAMALEVEDRPQQAGRFVQALHGEAPPEGAGDATRVVEEVPGSTAAAWGTRLDAASGTVSATPPPVEEHATPDDVARARRRRRRKRGAKRAGRLVLQILLTILVGIVATIAVAWLTERGGQGAEPLSGFVHWSLVLGAANG